MRVTRKQGHGALKASILSDRKRRAVFRSAQDDAVLMTGHMLGATVKTLIKLNDQTDDTALDQRPKAFNRVCVNRANDVLIPAIG